MQSKATTVSAYIKEQTPEAAKVLRAIRSLIKKHVPTIKGEMGYGMAMYTVAGGTEGFAFAAQKNYFSLYLSPAVVAVHKKKLGKLSVGKCCIRFRSLEQLPLDLIAQLLKESAQRMSEPEA